MHRIDPKVPRDEQFRCDHSKLLDDGVIRHVGLSEVSGSPTSRNASRFFKVATVQNRYNFADRASEDVLVYCEQHTIGFIPHSPLAAGEHAGRAAQSALTWLLARSPMMLPIPGTSSVAHLEENVAAAGTSPA